MAREVLSNGVINPDKYQADWYADLSNNWNLLNNLIGSAISGSEVDSKIATAIQELMVRTFQIVTELPETGTEGVMYLVAIPNTSKYTAYVWENSAYRELGVIQMTITIDDELSTTSENPVQNKIITNALGGKASSSHTHSASDITSGLATVATSGSYNDLSNKPTIPTVNDATLTIQQNGTTVDSFSANSSSDKTVNIQCVDLTNNQTVGGQKIFSNNPIGLGRDSYHFATSPYGKNTPPANTSYQYVFFHGNTASQGFTNSWWSGYLEQVVNINGSTRGRWFIRDTSENPASIELFANGSDKQVKPTENNAIDLGTSTNKWKTFNGVNPGALSLPSNSFVNVDTTNWDLTCQNELMGSFTPTADGWLMLHVANSGTSEVNLWIIGGMLRINNKSTSNTSANNNFNIITIPVTKDNTYNIYGNASEYVAGRSIAYCRFMPCKGNV